MIEHVMHWQQTQPQLGTRFFKEPVESYAAAGVVLLVLLRSSSDHRRNGFLVSQAADPAHTDGVGTSRILAARSFEAVQRFSTSCGRLFIEGRRSLATNVSLFPSPTVRHKPFPPTRLRLSILLDFGILETGTLDFADSLRVTPESITCAYHQCLAWISARDGRDG
eukprot:168532-Rhodomonas_salina.2